MSKLWVFLDLESWLHNCFPIILHVQNHCNVKLKKLNRHSQQPIFFRSTIHTLRKFLNSTGYTHITRLKWHCSSFLPLCDPDLMILELCGHINLTRITKHCHKRTTSFCSCFKIILISSLLLSWWFCCFGWYLPMIGSWFTQLHWMVSLAHGQTMPWLVSSNVSILFHFAITLFVIANPGYQKQIIISYNVLQHTLVLPILLGEVVLEPHIYPKSRNGLAALSVAGFLYSGW